ncbi:hypothetical protein [Bradyrhizobium sp.]|uniref:hypothetical protein n=1 Tax=Bradyrhizobium sp. TaxID=376 RepID=UPI0012E7DE2B|nr:hypothetical protein [Bradyrhizobium sp.]
MVREIFEGHLRTNRCKSGVGRQTGAKVWRPCQTTNPWSLASTQTHPVQRGQALEKRAPGLKANFGLTSLLKVKCLPGLCFSALVAISQPAAAQPDPAHSRRLQAIDMKASIKRLKELAGFAGRLTDGEERDDLAVKGQRRDLPR